MSLNRAEAVAAVRKGTPKEFRVFEDDFGNLVLAARRDLTHLEADALQDRLAAWLARDVRDPAVRAHVSFLDAHPAGNDEPDADVEAAWIDVEAWLVLDLDDVTPRARIDRFLGLVPRFSTLVDAAGRPASWRDPLHGSVE